MPAIIVTEIPRSGAALVAYVLETCGAWCVDEEYPRPHMYDAGANKEIRETLARPLLRGQNSDLLGIEGMPDESVLQSLADSIAPRWRDQVLAIIRRQGYESGPWVYRGADALLLWPVWAQAFPDAHWVFVRSDRNGIIESADKTVHVAIPQGRRAQMSWMDGYLHRSRRLASDGRRVSIIWPSRFIKGHFDKLAELVKSCGLTWDHATVETKLTPVLWSRGVYEVKGVH